MTDKALVLCKAQTCDTQGIIDLAVQSVSKEPLPVKTDTTAMQAMARQLIGNPAHFVWVARRGGPGAPVVACVAAHVSPGFWFRGLQCSVILYFSTVPGAGLALLREFARWVKSRSGIKVAVMELEPTTDPRLERAMRRLGFGRLSNNLTYVRT